MIKDIVILILSLTILAFVIGGHLVLIFCSLIIFLLFLEVNLVTLQFSKKFNLAVELVDERLSSFEAKEFTKDDNLDAMAAKLILDSWMNNNEHS